MPSNEPFSEELQSELNRFAEVGDRLAADGDYLAAIATYRRGFDFIPDPREGRSASLWFMVAIGDAQWFGGMHQQGKDTWQDVIFLYGGFGNPFVHLRRGQSLFELGDEKEAANELLRALLLGGEDIFAREPIDYWAFITGEADPPPEYPNWIGWPGLEKDSDEYRRWTDLTGVYKFANREHQSA